MVLDPPTLVVGLAKIDDTFSELNRISRALVARETRDGNDEYVDSAQPYEAKRRDTMILLSISLVAAIASVVWLYRSVVPRTRNYYAIAERLDGLGIVMTLESR